MVICVFCVFSVKIKIYGQKEKGIVLLLSVEII